MTNLGKSSWRQYIDSNPLTVILAVGLFLRLLASFFSEGYAFHDDHFCVTRVAQHWASGIPHWLEAEHPPKHSMFYAGINAVFIWLMEGVGIMDPIVKTTVLRLFHAFYSLLTIYFAYKITLMLSNRKAANLVGWILALLWFMPYLSVKFLAELVCVPPMLAGFYLILKYWDKRKALTFLGAGVLFGLAFVVRMHTVLFAGGIGIIFLFRKEWVSSILFTIGFLITAFIIIGIPDIIFFDYPFQYVVDYFAYNSENAYNYITGGPHKFLLTTLGFLVPPVSVFILWGFLRGRKVEPMMYVGIIIFFLVHSLFPNKQERFILPMYPMLIIIGIIGWNDFVAKSKFWLKNQRLHKGLWTFFWSINIIAAVAMALTFTKRDRVEPMYYLYHKNDVSSVIVESERGSVKQVPVYYMGTGCVDYNEFSDDLGGVLQDKATKKIPGP
ncbi:glycosyltransferase family 39 protein [Fulvivirga maritima]|uniref:ArnT family glycosyltransferase n=1 Tax=Fulvivirga maritima TaxID=2904247 RepID=UPI001F29866B|nr:glycosyltransferase family 39 protein [Fulvivirga maritima]UII26813.1 glycosyltransferase family 39 protein [Fulvivirga maritima]